MLAALVSPKQLLLRGQSFVGGSFRLALIWADRGYHERVLPYQLCIARSALAAFHDVVCVSFNYRTGPMGWMAFHEDVEAHRSTGNWGILDIQSAWACRQQIVCSVSIVRRGVGWRHTLLPAAVPN